MGDTLRGSLKAGSVALGLHLMTATLFAAPLQLEDPVLVIHGEPYATGDVTLSVDAPSGFAGQPVWFLLGIDPLPLTAPLVTGKGDFFVGHLTHVKPLGVMPAAGPLHVSSTLPDSVPGADGLHVVLQLLLPGRLSNPATVPLDAPYFLPDDATQIVPTELQFGAQFGDSHAVGDFNADGVQDIAVGAWREDLGHDDQGIVHVRWGPDFDTETLLVSADPGPKQYFGLGLAVADVNGDEHDDLIVGEASGGEEQPAATGRLSVFAGSTEFADTPTHVVPGFAQGAEAGVFGRILVAGDFNDDGHVDLVGAAESVAVLGVEKAGRVDVMWGPDFALSTSLTAPEPAELGFFGSRLAVGDVNGDGIDDLIEGSSRESYDGVNFLGRVHVFTGPDLAHFKTLDNPLPEGVNSRFGNALASADFDGDGLDEIVTTDQRGHGYVFWSPDFDSAHVLHAPPSSGGAGVSFGYFVDVGDVNGDGQLDVAIGAPFEAGTGAVHVYLGPHLNSALRVQEAPPDPNAEFGWFLSLHDVDGDGRHELLAGSPTGLTGVPGAGRLSVMDVDVGGTTGR